jgi:hypothetical protein
VENLACVSARAVLVLGWQMLGTKHSPAQGLVCAARNLRTGESRWWVPHIQCLRLVGCEVGAFVNRGTLKVMRTKKK